MELGIYNPSIWFIYKLFWALNATVHKFAVHPVQHAIQIVYPFCQVFFKEMSINISIVSYIHAKKLENPDI